MLFVGVNRRGPPPDGLGAEEHDPDGPFLLFRMETKLYMKVPGSLRSCLALSACKRLYLVLVETGSQGLSAVNKSVSLSYTDCSLEGV